MSDDETPSDEPPTEAPRAIEPETVALQIVPEGFIGNRTRFIRGVNPSLEPYMQGEGPLTMTCGHCGLVLVDSVEHGQFVGFALSCPECLRWNITPD